MKDRRGPARMKAMYQAVLFCFSFILFVAHTGADASSTPAQTTPAKLKQHIRSLNLSYEKHYQTKAVSALLDMYHSDFSTMFEFKPAIFDQKHLQSFYEDYFKLADILRFEKTAIDYTVSRNYIIEIGNFNLRYRLSHSTENSLEDKHAKGIQDSAIKAVQTHDYAGKYMVVWKQNDRGKLKILAEIYGSSTRQEPKQLPYAQVNVEEQLSHVYFPADIDPVLQNEIEVANADLLRSVCIGDSHARVAGHADDAITGRIMKGWFDGKAAFAPELLSVYVPENRLHAWHRYYKAYDLNDYILTVGHFKGGWGDRKSGGAFEGNVITLRTRAGKTPSRIYREMATNDRPYVVFNSGTGD